ncbi:MAG: NAD-dependent deacylase [Betaproteobacteria bacterium]|nr:NAD-dependent deacylase [Betaproteobacteria bacterium]
MAHPTPPPDLAAARAALSRARSIAVLTGAGISAESGVPTFRDALTGLWSRFRPEDLATPEAFSADPATVWSWYADRRARVASVQPNAGHHALVAMERAAHARGAAFTLVTQNVDGLHQAAGSGTVIELHGNLRRVKCFDRHHPAVTWDERETPPRCTQCASLLRPDVVWFGEALPQAALDAACAAAGAAQVFLSIGTSTLVEPAASLPFAALQAGACVIEVNPAPTPLTAHATWVLAGPAAAIMPVLAAP